MVSVSAGKNVGVSVDELGERMTVSLPVDGADQQFGVITSVSQIGVQGLVGVGVGMSANNPNKPRTLTLITYESS